MCDLSSVFVYQSRETDGGGLTNDLGHKGMIHLLDIVIELEDL
jgi:hypothetical protein